MTKSKKFLIGGLVSVLGGLWLEPLFLADTPGPPIENRARRNNRRPPSPVPVPQAASEGWTPAEIKFDFDEVVAFDPFAKSETMKSLFGESDVASDVLRELNQGNESQARDLAEGKRAQLRETLAQLQDRGVDLILETDGGPIARIGSKTLKEGDVIDGFRVVRIGSNGIVIKSADEQENP